MEVSGPEIDHCLEALRQTRTHGGVRPGSFHAPEHGVFDRFASRNLLVDVDGGDELGFARHFSSSAAVRSLFPEAQRAELPKDDMLDFPPVFGWGSPLRFLMRSRRALHGCAPYTPLIAGMRGCDTWNTLRGCQ